MILDLILREKEKNLLDKLRDLRLILSKLAGILGEFAATERRELEVDTSREISLEIFCCDHSRPKVEQGRRRTGEIPVVYDKSELRIRCRIARAWDVRVAGIEARIAATTQESTRLRDQFHVV